MTENESQINKEQNEYLKNKQQEEELQQKFKLNNIKILNEFKKLIDKGFPILEEVSAVNYYWTPLHYAMHFGKMEIAFYILDLLIKQGKYNMAMKLQSNDGRTPVLCLLKSSELSLSDKKEYFTKLVQRYKIDCDERTMKEIKNRNLDDIYKTYQARFK